MSKIRHILSVIHYTIRGAVCFQFTHFLVMVERIYILCLIIIIKSEVWTITHCLGLGHETMVCAVCLFVFLWARVCINETNVLSMCSVHIDRQHMYYCRMKKSLMLHNLLSACLSISIHKREKRVHTLAVNWMEYFFLDFLLRSGLYYSSSSDLLTNIWLWDRFWGILGLEFTIDN